MSHIGFLLTATAGSCQDMFCLTVSAMDLVDDCVSTILSQREIGHQIRLVISIAHENSCMPHFFSLAQFSQ